MKKTTEENNGDYAEFVEAEHGSSVDDSLVDDEYDRYHRMARLAIMAMLSFLFVTILVTSYSSYLSAPLKRMMIAHQEKEERDRVMLAECLPECNIEIISSVESFSTLHAFSMRLFQFYSEDLREVYQEIGETPTEKSRSALSGWSTRMTEDEEYPIGRADTLLKMASYPQYTANIMMLASQLARRGIDNAEGLINKLDSACSSGLLMYGCRKEAREYIHKISAKRDGLERLLQNISASDRYYAPGDDDV